MAGEKIIVEDQSDPDWWLGVSTSGKGYFPKSYLRMKSNAPTPPKRTPAIAAQAAKPPVQPASSRRVASLCRTANFNFHNFSLTSLDSFDQLMETGDIFHVYL